jgi:hypothetical protein
MASCCNDNLFGGSTMNNWWPVTDEEWEQLNFPKQPKKLVTVH